MTEPRWGFPSAVESPGKASTLIPPRPERLTHMNKLLTALMLAAFAITGAQAASHAGAAPMKADAAKPAASAPAKAKKAKAAKPAASAAKKVAAKKEEAKK